MTEPRVLYSDVRPIILPAALTQLHGPTTGAHELPRYLAWSGQTSFDFGDDHDLLSAYKIVIVEAMRPDYLHEWLDEATLRRLWPQLGLPVAVRARWEQAFPDLAT